MGLSRESVANYMRLLKLPREVMELLIEKRINFAKAKELLKLGDNDRIAQADVRPARAVDVETQDARHLALHLSSARIAVNLAVHARIGGLSEADSDRLPPGVGEECEVQVPAIGVAFGRRFVPGADEIGARPK